MQDILLDLYEAEALYRIHSQNGQMLNINIYSKCEVLESDLKQYHLSKNKNNFKIDESQNGFVSARYLTFWVLRLLDAELEFGNGIEALPEMWLYS